MDSLLRDCRYALRMLVQRPLFAIVAALSVAVGIGATTAVFSVVNALLLRAPAGIGEPERAVEIGRTNGGRGFDTFSYPELLDLQAQTDVFSHVAGWRSLPLSFSVNGEGLRAHGFLVSHTYFDVMAVRPLRGRFFTAEEDRTPGAHAVAVVSHGFWQDQLGGDPDVIGRTITLNRHAFTIIGVAPPDFRGHVVAIAPDVYLPMMMMPVAEPGFDAFAERRASWLHAVARLAPGVKVEQADTAVKTVFVRHQPPDADPGNVRSAAVIPLGPIPGGGRTPVAAFLGLLGALIGFVLVITCTNVAGMLLARAAAREREIAIRLAIGSGRGALVRQLVIESALLFLIAGAGGVMLAAWLTDALSSARFAVPGEGMTLALDLRPDPFVLAFGLALALATGLVFGLAPALHATRVDLVAAMKNDDAHSGSREGWLRRTFVTGQLALSLVLLIAAGLFLRSLQRAAVLPTGFNATGVGLVPFDLAIDGYDERRGRAIGEALTAAALAQPGIVAAALAADLPLDLSTLGGPVYPEQPGANDPGHGVQASFNVVTPGYFETLQVRLLGGRLLDDSDRHGAPPVVVISRTLAERAFPGRDAVGQRLRSSSPENPLLTVVGVVEDVKNQSLMEAPDPMVYLPYAQHYRPDMALLVRAERYGPVVMDALRAALQEVDPNLSVGAIQSLEGVTAIGTLPQRIAAVTTTALGALALVLSALGVYGVIAHHVVRRTREIGIRIAIGAHRTDVVRLVLRDGLRLAAPGIAIGVAAGFALGRLVRAFILGVPPADPATFGLVPAVLFAAVAFACWFPARRAAATPPSVVLRAE